MSLTTNLKNSYALEANSNDAVGGVNGTDTSISYSSVGGKLSAGFNGSSSKITMSAPTLTGTGDMTFVGWIYPNNVTTVNQYFVTNRKASDDNLGIYAFHIDNTNSKLNFWDFNGGAFGFSPSSYSTTALSANTWYHVAFVRSGGVNGTYYLNGSADGTTTSAASKSYSTDASHPMVLGSEPASSYFFAGQMLSWQCYERALSSGEINELYNGGTVLQYPFSASFTPTPLMHMIQVTGGNM